jgi:hypothetical protein
MKRKYEPIWDSLKASIISPASRAKGVFIKAHPAYHPRIIKGVVKEKDQDVGFKLSLYPKRAKLEYSAVDSVITFKLQIYPTSIADKLELS